MDKQKVVNWIKAAGIRAIKTGAQIFGAFLVTGAAVSDVNWGYAASVTAVAMIASVFTSVAGLPELKGGE